MKRTTTNAESKGVLRACLGRSSVLAALLSIGLVAFAQQSDTAVPPATNHVAEGRDDADQASVQTNETTPPDTNSAQDLEHASAPSQPTGTNQTSTVAAKDSPPGEAQNQRDRRRRSQSSRTGTNRAGEPSREQEPPPGEKTSNGRDFSSFKIISDRNIFDPNRGPRRAAGPRERQAKVDSFSLVGIMSYEKGSFAFFDGSSSDYKKALKLNDSIAGYKLMSIAPTSIKLVSGTNEVQLQVGTQMRREDEGAWAVSSKPETLSASTSTSSSSSPPASSGADSDILKKLMQRREQE